jgi:hypothetical protein
MGNMQVGRQVHPSILPNTRYELGGTDIGDIEEAEPETPIRAREEVEALTHTMARDVLKKYGQELLDRLKGEKIPGCVVLVVSNAICSSLTGFLVSKVIASDDVTPTTLSGAGVILYASVVEGISIIASIRLYQTLFTSARPIIKLAKYFDGKVKAAEEAETIVLHSEDERGVGASVLDKEEMEMLARLSFIVGKRFRTQENRILFSDNSRPMALCTGASEEQREWFFAEKSRLEDNKTRTSFHRAWNAVDEFFYKLTNV